MSRTASKLSSRILALIAVGLTAQLGGCANEQQSTNPSLLGSANGDGKGGYGRNGYGPGAQQAFQTNVGDLVYFSSDSSDLTPEAQETLRNQAGWLNQYREHRVTIEGHADERGTREYNIALGARRANTVKSFLSAQGVDAQRIRTVSYGKERPIASCDDISCWSQNRRAQTILANAVASR